MLSTTLLLLLHFRGSNSFIFSFASLLNEGNLLKEFAPLQVLGEKSAQQEIYSQLVLEFNPSSVHKMAEHY